MILPHQVLSVLQHLMPSLPPVAALRAFEATARLGGFARAAAELHVSTSAISHQIRGLEENLGARLLERSTGVGGVRVTPAGTRLLAAAGTALTLLEDACSAIRGGVKHSLTVSANVSLSTTWLAARLADFSAQHPEIAVNGIIQMEAPDFIGLGIDLAIVHVPEAALLPTDVVLMQEDVYPVCSPDLYQVASQGVYRCPLLQEGHDGSQELDWHHWARVLKFPSDVETRIVHYSTFGQAISAAIGGAGVALGRSPLINQELRTGRLVRLFPELSRPASWRFVLRLAPRQRHPMVRTLIEFLRQQVLRDVQEP